MEVNLYPSHLIGNLAVGSTAALRLTGHVNTSGHTIYNTVLDKWDYRSNAGGRARFLWKPSDNLTLNVWMFLLPNDQ